MTPDETVRRAALLLCRGAVPLEEFVAALDSDTASACFEQLRERLTASSVVHDHPRRPRCWSCGDGTDDDQHHPWCEALVAVARAYVDEPDEYPACDRPTNRKRWGGVLQRAIVAGVDLSRIRRDREALELASRKERVWPR